MRFKAVVVFDFEDGGVGPVNKFVLDELAASIAALLFTERGRELVDAGSVGVQVYPL